MKDLVFDLIEQEKVRQSEGLELIPSENYVSEDVLQAMGSILTNKYSEGYPSFDGINEWSESKIAKEVLPNYRYYGGQINIDRIERLTIDRACKLFHADHANVREHRHMRYAATYILWQKPLIEAYGLVKTVGKGVRLLREPPAPELSHGTLLYLSTDCIPVNCCTKRTLNHIIT